MSTWNYNTVLDRLEAGGLLASGLEGKLFDELPTEQQKALVAMVDELTAELAADAAPLSQLRRKIRG
jgi:hypothetical protein